MNLQEFEIETGKLNERVKYIQSLDTFRSDTFRGGKINVFHNLQIKLRLAGMRLVLSIWKVRNYLTWPMRKYTLDTFKAANSKVLKEPSKGNNFFSKARENKIILGSNYVLVKE